MFSTLFRSETPISAMGVVKWLGTTRLMVMKGFMKNAKVNTNKTEDFSLKALVLGTIRLP